MLSWRPCAGARAQVPARAIQPKYHLIWLQVRHLVNTTHFTAVVFCTSVNITLIPSLCVRPSDREQQVHLCSSLCGGGGGDGWLAALVARSHWKRSTKVSKSEVQGRYSEDILTLDNKGLPLFNVVPILIFPLEIKFTHVLGLNNLTYFAPIILGPIGSHRAGPERGSAFFRSRAGALDLLRWKKHDLRLSDEQG